MKPPPRSLQRQILLSFVAFAAAVSVLFAGCSFLIAYVVEDMIFEDTIAGEVSRQQNALDRTGAFAPPGRDFISIHESSVTFPPDLRQRFPANAVRGEYRGADGRHYHVVRFLYAGGRSAFAVAEVSGHLAVRPITGELLLLIGLGSGLILIVAVLLGAWLARTATGPLSRMVAAVSQGRAGEVPRITASEFPRNEVGALAAMLEQMLDQARDFVERESRFTRDASHELRTPLSVIRTSTELIEARGDIPRAMQKPLSRIAGAAAQMEQAISLLLLLAREEQAQSPAASTPLLPLIEKVVLAESARHGADAFDVQVAVRSDARISVNQSVAISILSNLIGNAFQHTAPGTVTIRASGSDLIITDTGHGLPEGLVADLEQEPAASPKRPRRGLGLSIVWRLCRVHAVPVRAESGPNGTSMHLGIIHSDEGSGTRAV